VTFIRNPYKRQKEEFRLPEFLACSDAEKVQVGLLGTLQAAELIVDAETSD
jgi:hypothetical protein